MTLHINRMRDRASVVGFITYNEYTSKAGKRMAYARKDYTAMRHPLALATPRLAPDKSSNGRTHSLRKPFGKLRDKTDREYPRAITRVRIRLHLRVHNARTV